MQCVCDWSTQAISELLLSRGAVPQDEAQFFLKIFDKYHKHLVRHPHTLLPRLVIVESCLLF